MQPDCIGINPNCELNAAERAEIKKLSAEQIAGIDSALLTAGTDVWQKQAKVIAIVMGESKFNLPDVYFGERVQSLIKQGKLHVMGDPCYMQFSELKRADSPQP